MPSRTKKFRGYRTHGRGKKSGRGAGIIGGHGKAGYGKTGKIGMPLTDVPQLPLCDNHFCLRYVLCDHLVNRKVKLADKIHALFHIHLQDLRC